MQPPETSKATITYKPGKEVKEAKTRTNARTNHGQQLPRTRLPGVHGFAQAIVARLDRGQLGTINETPNE
jgi:hypothetical protein